MKKTKIKILALLLLVSVIITSCATVFCGPVSTCQRTKPAPGQPSREVRAGALVLDVLLFVPGVIVDFATGAIYKPCTNK
ncbi:MAG: hypothetical protein WA816_13985 [Bacteroidales bacterium]